MKSLKLFLLVLASSWALGASAQWQWVDKDGRKVFSDRPPPADVPDKNILKQPYPSRRTPSPAAPVTQPPAQEAQPQPASTPKSASGQDAKLQQEKAKQEAAEAAKQKAEQARAAQVRAENCERARGYRTTLTSGRTLAQVNAAGERVVMDDAARNAELQRVEKVIASDCAPTQ